MSKFCRPEVQNQGGIRLCFLQRRFLFLVSSSSWWLLAFLGLCCQSFTFCPCLHMACPCGSLLCVSHGNMSLDLGPTQMNPGWSHFEFLNLITSAKMLFLNKVTFTGSAGSEFGHTFCGGPALNHYKMTLGPSSRGSWVGGDKAAHSCNSFFFLIFLFSL